MLKAKEFRFYAREALKGRWIQAGGVGILAGFLGAAIDISGASGTAGNGAQSGSNMSNQLGMISDSSQVSGTLLAVLLGIGLLIAVWTIVMVVIGGATTLGYAKYNLNLVDDTDPKLKDIFSQYDRLGTGFGMQFFRFIFIFLWSLLLVIPGIIAAYSYAMTPYILCESPDMTAREAIKKSKELMKGNRWRLFCLEISFIGWEILAGIGLSVVIAMVSGMVLAGAAVVGIVFGSILIIAVFVAIALILSPYITVSSAVFYREISEGRYSDPQIIREVREDYRSEETIVE